MPKYKLFRINRTKGNSQQSKFLNNWDSVGITGVIDVSISQLY